MPDLTTATSAAAIHPGTFVHLSSRQSATDQFISIDDETDSCWVPRWPLTFQGSPAFAVTLREARFVTA